MTKGTYKRQNTEEIKKISNNLICKTCGKRYELKPQRCLKYLRTRKFCSRNCYFKSKEFLNAKHSANSGTFKNGHLPVRIQNGSLNSMWKGGISHPNRLIRAGKNFRLWREAVFARDNWTCQKTETKGGKLHPHHIQNFAQFPELRFAIDNGITLSEKAHKEFHKIYGKNNNTREQLEEFLGKTAESN